MTAKPVNHFGSSILTTSEAVRSVALLKMLLYDMNTTNKKFHHQNIIDQNIDNETTDPQ